MLCWYPYNFIFSIIYNYSWFLPI